jgi:hypothetical protein
VRGINDDYHSSFKFPAAGGPTSSIWNPDTLDHDENSKALWGAGRRGRGGRGRCIRIFLRHYLAKVIFFVNVHIVLVCR